MVQELLGLLCFIGMFVLGFGWYFLGRAICLLILNDFIWTDFVKEYKDFDGESFIQTLLYYFFPITLIFLSLLKMFDRIRL